MVVLVESLDFRGRAAPIIGCIRPRLFFLALILSGSALVCGCAHPRQTEPEVNPNELNDQGFQVYLARAPLITVDEAYRAMLILADGEDTSQGFAERKEKLESRGIARAAWNLQAENVIDAGSLAFMVCRICKISGGVNSTLFGSWGLGDRRYALRELIYRQMVDEMIDYQFVTGADLHGLMRKADAFMMEKGLYESENIDLTDEGDRDEHGELIVPPSPN